MVPVASGLIAGESILKALLAMLATAIGLAG
jgi:branched-subunit amino acid permease